MNAQEARQLFAGPIPSLRTPFHRDGTIDYTGLANLIDYTLSAGAKALMLTAGDSHYLCLTDEEIADITRFVCDRARGRAAVIAADRQFGTARAVAFAEFAKAAGAATVMCLPPDWAASCTSASLAQHYAAVAGVLPVTIVTNIFIPRGPAFAMNTIRQSLDASDAIIAIKDDMGGAFAQQMCLNFADRVAIYAGGQKQNHLSIHAFGAHGYLSTFLTFKADIAHRYWRAIRANELAVARQIIATIEIPWWQHFLAHTGGFDACLHGAMEIFGLSARWRRPPYHSLSDEEMDQLRQFLASLPL